MEQSTAAEGKTRKRHQKKRRERLCESVSGHTDKSDQDRDYYGSLKGEKSAREVDSYPPFLEADAAKSTKEKKTGKKRRSLSCGGLADLSGDFSRSVDEHVTATSRITALSKKTRSNTRDGGDFQDFAPSPQKKKKHKGEAAMDSHSQDGVQRQEKKKKQKGEAVMDSQEGAQRLEKKKKQKGEASSQINTCEESTRDSSAKSTKEKKSGKKRRSLSCGGLTDLSGDFSRSVGEHVTATSRITASSKNKHFSDGGDFQDVAPSPQKKKKHKGEAVMDSQEGVQRREKKKKQKGEAKSQVNMSENESRWTILEGSSAMDSQSREGVQRREKKKKWKGEADVDSQEGVQRLERKKKRKGEAGVDSQSQEGVQRRENKKKRKGEAGVDSQEGFQRLERKKKRKGEAGVDSQSQEGVQRQEKKKKRKGEAGVDSQEGVQRQKKKKKQKHSTRERYAPHTSGVDGGEALPDDVNEGGSDSGVGQVSETVVGGFDQHSRETQRDNWQTDSPKKKKKRKRRDSSGSQTTDMDSVGGQGTEAAVSNCRASSLAHFSDSDTIAGNVDDSVKDKIRKYKSATSTPRKTKKKKKPGKERNDPEPQVTVMDSSCDQESTRGSSAKVKEATYQATGSGRTSHHQHDYQGSLVKRKDGTTARMCVQDCEHLHSTEMSQSLGSEAEEAVSNAESSHEADGRPQGAATEDRKKRQKSKKVSPSKTKQAEKMQRHVGASGKLQSPGKTKSVELIELEGDDCSSSGDEGELPNCDTGESHGNGTSQSSGSREYNWDLAKCYLCNEAVSGKEAYIAHLAQQHGKFYYRCHKCSRGLSLKSQVQLHMSVCRFKDHREDMLLPFHCFVCPMSYAHRCSLQRHLLRAHATGKPVSVDAKCQHCGRSFTASLGAKSHKLSCTECLSKLCKQCGQCGKLFASQKSLYSHINTLHSDRFYKCLCGRKIRSASYYYFHRKNCVVFSDLHVTD